MLKPGAKVGVYEVVALIGAGGMGDVYRARDSRLDRDVAIKILRGTATDGVTWLARLEREARILASLSHPNIGALYGLEEIAGSHALVLELVPGATLADRLAHGPLPTDLALRIAQQIAAALQAAHEQGITHRDLKPGNVMVRPDGLVKVLDFGLAKVSDGGQADQSSVITSHGTRPGVVLGTPAYMAPEQMSGRTVDKSADIWAFGAVLYEMLTGQRAFPGGDTAQVLAGVLRDEPRWELLPPDAPPSVRRLLQRCLAKDPRARLRDIGDVRLEIEDVTANGHRATAALSPVRRFGSSRRAATAGLAFLVLAAAGIGALGVRFMSPAAGDDRRAGSSGALPLVIMMDSAHPARVYDPETLAASATNADVISDLLSDLPIRRQKETIGPEWHRDEEIRQFRPDLIVIHYSGFNQEDATGPRTRLKTLVQFLADTPTKFLIYSRATEADLDVNLTALLSDLYVTHPGLRAQVRAFGLLDYGPPRWVKTVTGTQLKLVIKEILNLP
ncbi:MAG: serine/threonine protein kinase [Gemmatimonadetes bacterium]|nr:serine/threonine protein kinase [Gemmatimonadota bacterium]